MGGLRQRTRHQFARPFRCKGFIPLTTYLRTFKVGDYVDIKMNGAIHKGMAHKWYQGKTGVVWNVTKRAIGVEIMKPVKQRYIVKRIHVRIEHVKPSRCREDFLNRSRINDAKKAEARKAGQALPNVRRQPAQPREGFMLTGVQAHTIAAIPYDVVKEGIKT